MTTEIKDGGPAFPCAADEKSGWHAEYGMSLRDWFAGQAVTNPQICTGVAPDWELTRWFGPHRTGITKAEIIARQALDASDAMLKAREGGAA